MLKLNIWMLALMFGAGDSLNSSSFDAPWSATEYTSCCNRERDNSSTARGFCRTEVKDLTDKISLAELISPTLIVIRKVVSLSPFWPYSSIEAACMAEAK
ncbi:hypothetical protein Q3G72_013864 [Acer saccharum]|nr:hypothetical protein Q3G72_013864 [Acer saccharum]